jgi:hypothetical protein
MSLEGLRAWIGEVERKLGKRTRVFLALAVIAIGLGGAAIYLAIDARESSVSESDVQELQQELEAQIDESAAGTGGVVVPPAESEAEPAPGAEAEPAPAPGSKPDEGASSPPTDGASGGVGTGGASSGADDNAPAGGAGGAKIQELLEQAKKQNAEAEAEQADK